VDGSESGTGEARSLTSLTDLYNIPHKGQPLGVNVPVLQLAHSKNISKHKKSSITLEELLTKIEEFDKKYNGE